MKKAIVFTNGTYAEERFYRRYMEEYGPFDIICADGGTNFVHRLGLVPQTIVGDMDSVRPEVLADYEKKGVRIDRHPTHKDETDTELAVNYCVEAGYSTVILLGALGTRLDHSLGNLYLLNRMLALGIHAEAVDPVNRVFLVDTHCTLELPVGTVVSVMAYTDIAEGITLKGFEYPVNKGKMDHLVPGYGISNVTKEKKPEIFVEKGTLLVDIVSEF